MKLTKETYITAFALFSLFFGAGNLILPPLLGYSAGENWIWVTLGFATSAVIIPILGIVAHARLQGTMLDFGNKVHPVFSLIYCIIVYLISISLPAPRTASVTYEMGVQPYLEWSSLTFSALYFGLVLLFVLNRSKLLNIIGKYLTPFLIMILVMIIGVAAVGGSPARSIEPLKSTFTGGVLEGYQTFDAIGAVVVGAVVIISLNLKNYTNYAHKRKMIAQGGILAGLALFCIYAGLIYAGAIYSAEPTLNTRTELLSFISYDTLGSGGRIMLSVLIGLACFTTAVGIVTGTADFVRGLFKGSHKAYVITAILGCLLGVAVGQFKVDFIIAIAVPALYFIYPVTIILIILNVLPQRITSHWVFKIVVITTIIFSIPDFLVSLGLDQLETIKNLMPLGTYGMGWTLPALLALLLANIAIKYGILPTENQNDKLV